MLIGIFGTGRNGSTLISRLLDGLAGTYVHPVEENFLSVMNELVSGERVRRSVQQNCSTRPLRDLSSPVPTERLSRRYRASVESLRKTAEQTWGEGRTLPDFALESALGSHALQPAEFIPRYLGALARWVQPEIRFTHHAFKTIEVPYIRQYEEHFPGMRFIHIVRHPVDVCSSQKRTLMQQKSLPASYLGLDWLACMVTKRWIPHAAAILTRRGDPAHAVVRYEDLVQDSTAEIRRLADWLGLGPPPRPNRQTLFHDVDPRTLTDNPSKPGLTTPREAVAQLQSRYGYDEVLTKREIDFIAVKTRGLLEPFGYESPSAAGRADLLVQYLKLDRWELMHCNTPGTLARGLAGVVYRRFALL